MYTQTRINKEISCLTKQLLNERANQAEEGA